MLWREHLLALEGGLTRIENTMYFWIRINRPLCFGASKYTLTVVEKDLDEVGCDKVNRQDCYDYTLSKVVLEGDVVAMMKMP